MRRFAFSIVWFGMAWVSTGVGLFAPAASDCDVGWSPVVAAEVPSDNHRAVSMSASVAGLQVPDGFVVQLYADDDLAHDIFSLTIDAAGRVVVAGQGYIKTLLDDDGDGQADRAIPFAATPREGARGLCFVGNQLYCIGDHALSLLEDRDGDLIADGPPRVIRTLRQNDGHSSNGVLQGPDGWLYVACGNDVLIEDQHADSPLSPVRHPQRGAMLRISPDGSRSEVVAHGFRNPYDLDFDSRGALFTVDADGERDQYMPWYTPTRLFDVATGMHHGWVLPGWVRSWNRPPWLFDNVERLVEIGRGSPTGVIVYRHRQFPSAFRGSVFSCCWSLGRIYHFPLEPTGATYRSHREIFLQATGGTGFAPVDLAVGPAGDLFVAIGGRGTRGGVFRIAYAQPADAGSPPQAATPLDRVLRAEQPLASWSRAIWQPLAQQVGAAAFVAALRDPQRTTPEKIRAVEVLTELFEGLDAQVAAEWLHTAQPPVEPAVAARVAWSLSRHPRGNAGERLLAELTHADDAWLQRAAWESLLSQPQLTAAALHADWLVLAEPAQRRVRAAAIRAAARLDAPLFTRMQSELAAQMQSPASSAAAYATNANAADVPDPANNVALAWLWCRHARGELTEEDFSSVLSTFRNARSAQEKLEAVRLLQLALGDLRAEPTTPDVYAGYVPARPATDAAPLMTAVPELAAAFPTNDAALNHELLRLLGMIAFAAGAQAADAFPLSFLDAIAARATSDSRVEDDVHDLIVMSQLPGPRSAATSQRTAATIAGLHHKLQRGVMVPSRFWPSRVGEAFAELCRRDPRLPQALLAHADFRLAAQAMFAARLDEADRQTAARHLIDRAGDDWTEELVRLSAALPAELHQPRLRALFADQFTLRDAIVEVLAANPHREDRERFVQMLASGQPATTTTAASALTRLGGTAAPAEIADALRAMRQLSRERQFAASVQQLNDLLQVWTGHRAAVAGNPPDAAALVAAWSQWFAERFPEQTAALASEEQEAATLLARLDAIDWSAGDPQRGRAAFDRLTCARCHGEQSRLGPDLTGIVNRFSRRDLFVAIADPHRDVSPAYRITQVVTASGRIVAGQIVYESPAATLVQTGPDTTVRITGEEIVALQRSALSPMPSGLLRTATDAELADLYAYLQTLTRPISP
jgi:putative membrane-bound dehydrogenase-like protein